MPELKSLDLSSLDGDSLDKPFTRKIQPIDPVPLDGEIKSVFAHLSVCQQKKLRSVDPTWGRFLVFSFFFLLF